MCGLRAVTSMSDEDMSCSMRAVLACTPTTHLRYHGMRWDGSDAGWDGVWDGSCGMGRGMGSRMGCGMAWDGME
jgi:hypothetical protein